PEGYIDELFTEHEAGQLADYLSTFKDSTTTVEEVALPIGNDTMAYGALPVGGGTDFYMLSKKEGYPLPFSVWGFSTSVAASASMAAALTSRTARATTLTSRSGPDDDLNGPIPF